jgi:hypothetical protein
VTGNADPSHLRGLIDTCVGYWHLENVETQAAGTATDVAATDAAGATAEAGTAETGAGGGGWVPDRAANARLMDDLLRQIIGKATDFLSGEPGLASLLRRGLAGPGLGGPSLPLDVGDTDDIPGTSGRPSTPAASNASSPAAATAPPPNASPTTSSTAPTTAPPPSPASATSVTSTTTSSPTQTGPARPGPRTARPSSAATSGHRPSHRHPSHRPSRLPGQGNHPGPTAARTRDQALLAHPPPPRAPPRTGRHRTTARHPAPEPGPRRRSGAAPCSAGPNRRCL